MLPLGRFVAVDYRYFKQVKEEFPRPFAGFLDKRIGHGVLIASINSVHGVVVVNALWFERSLSAMHCWYYNHLG